MKRSELFLSTILVPLDAIMIVAAFALAYYCRAHLGGVAPFAEIGPTQYLLYALMLLPIWIIIFANHELYTIYSGRSFYHQAYRVAAANSVAMLFLVLLIFLTKTTFFSRLVLLFTWLLSIILVIIGRFAVDRLRHYLLSRGISSRHVLLLGNNAVISFISGEIVKNASLGLRVAALIADGPDKAVRVLEALDKQHIDEIMIADDTLPAEDLTLIIKACLDRNIIFRYMPEFFFAMMPSVVAQNIGSMPTLKLQSVKLEGWGRIIKRLFDIIVSALAILILSPLLILIALLVKLTSPGPVLYSHERVGRDGRVFRLYKFRSMRQNAETTEGRFWTQANDNRITPFGAWLRRTNFDELPQLYNILIGEMSLVGPRPEQPRFVDQFKQEVPDYFRRHLVKSGLTGWAQVNGFKGDTSIAERVRYDTFYIEHWSFWLDLKIISMTSTLVIREITGNKYEYRDRA